MKITSNYFISTTQSFESIMSVILPGDDLGIATDNIETSIGPGIYRLPGTEEPKLIPINAGILNIKRNKQGTRQATHLESNSRRYIPQVNDMVIGTIVGVYAEYYKVLLQNFLPNVTLSVMAFPNATKKNRPNLKQGQCVYARVSSYIPELETELECFDPTTGKEGGFGLLDESGYVFDVELNFARELLFNSGFLVLEKLSTKCMFEIAIGINGKIWLKCGDGIPVPGKTSEDDADKMEVDSVKDLKATLAAANYIKRCQKVSPSEFDKVLAESFKGL